MFIKFKNRSIELRKSELKKCPNIPAMLRERLKVRWPVLLRAACADTGAVCQQRSKVNVHQERTSARAAGTAAAPLYCQLAHLFTQRHRFFCQQVPARGKLMLRTQVLADSSLPPLDLEVPITGELPPRKYILDTGPVRAAVEKLGRQFECFALLHWMDASRVTTSQTSQLCPQAIV